MNERTRRVGAGRAWSVLLAAAALCTACQGGTDGHWEVVEAYLTLDTTWHAKSDEIYRAEGTDVDKEARREAELGPHPDITLAVAAARAILATPGHARTLEAAEFLVEHPYMLSKTASDDMQLGIDTLAQHLGPDWGVIEQFREDRVAWSATSSEISQADLSDEDKQRRRDELGSRPTITRALGAATAILRGDAEDHLAEAAAFVLGMDAATSNVPAPRMLEAAQVVLDRLPDYAAWPESLQALNWARRGSEATNAVIDQVFAEVRERTVDPVARATARYYAAAGLMRDSNAWTLSDEDRQAIRERALEMATGLSADVADVAFIEPVGVDDVGDPQEGTIAEAEADLKYRISFTTVGATVPDVTGQRLDGTEEALSAHAGKVVLVDFWATWCGPCIAALPKLRDLHESLPADRFTLLAVSVDAELDTVTEFQEDEPMPWVNWHVGDKSEIVRTWDVRAFPTYVLLDENGTILARTSGWSDAVEGRVRAAVNGDLEESAPPDATAA